MCSWFLFHTACAVSLNFHQLFSGLVWQVLVLVDFYRQPILVHLRQVRLSVGAVNCLESPTEIGVKCTDRICY